ncbi:MAG: type II secretion system F family protein [Candidatus Vogelbacteria bacterium]|nr:type II secretion system F family protein [Candidatus Vogelbacteria bacterium]
MIVNLTSRAILAKHLAVMLTAGLTLSEALAVAIDSTAGNLKRVLRRVQQSVQSGTAFSQALGAYPKVFSGVFVSAVYAGERSGNLAVNLANLSRALEKERALLAKVKGAMIYPAIVLAAAVALGLGLAFFILPKITPLFRGLRIALPWTTRLLISFADFIDAHGAAFFLGLVLGAIFLPWLLKRRSLAFLTHWCLLHFPAVGRISANLNLARLAGTIGLLLKSGVNIDETLAIAEKTTGNFYYRRALRRISADVGRGLKLSESFERFPKLFPLLFSRMARVGEVSGRFEETFFYLTDFYEDEVDAAAKSLSTALEPILLLVIGLVVAGLALSIITPIYEITGNIRR